jgi:1-phosphatidylinositol-4-phosphate 5-kinase
MFCSLLHQIIVLGAVDPHNMLQLQRWRRKKKHAGVKSYVKGKVIDGRHELYTLSIAVMLGVRTSIAKTNTILTSANGRRMLTPHDFMTEEKYEFSPKGSPTTPPHKLSHTFKFKDYAPMAFAYLRRMFGVNEFDFLLSVCGNANFIEFISNAKSGQFFFYSSDGKYMIKTMTNEESKFLRRSKLFEMA